MPHANFLAGRTHAAAAVAWLVLYGLLSGGCASTTIQAQWTDPRFTGQSLRGEKVLVVCNASAAAITRICQDQLAAQVAAAAAMPVVVSDADYLVAEGGQITDNALTTARREGAKAILVSIITPDTTVVRPGPTVGFGFGGFGGTGGWYRSSGIGAGVGVSVPVGAERIHTAYAANMSLTDVDTGRLMWSSTVTTPASQDITAQVNKLAKAGVEAAQQAGIL
jgi:hypothetical protein